MEESNPNILETFVCARQDKEMILSRITIFVIYYLVFLGVALFVNLIIVHKGHVNLGVFIQPLVFAGLLYILFSKKIRHYTIDYKNAVIIDMGSQYEIVHSPDITGLEVLDKEKSFEFIKRCKLTGYMGTYQTKTHGTIKAFAVNRDYFVLIKTKTIPGYVISPQEPRKFVEFMNSRLHSSIGKSGNEE